MAFQARARSLSIALMLLLIAPGFLAGEDDAVERVGRWGDLRRLSIHGTQAVPAAEIQRALTKSFPVLLASHPAEPLAQLPEVLRQRITDGYLHAGFADAEVEVRLDREQQRVEITIHEGPRTRAGEIRVKGVEPPLAELLAQLLEQPQRPGNATAALDDHGGVLRWIDAQGQTTGAHKPQWVVGGPAPLDEVTHARMSKQVQRTLKELGYHQASFDSQVRRQGARAEWVIQVDELGSPSLLQDIIISGNQRNTSGEILEYLSLRPGVIATRELEERVQRSLWNSGRFTSQKVSTEHFDFAGGSVMRIHLDEYPHAPRLSEPLSRAEATMLKHRKWLVDGPGRERDLVIRAKDAGRCMEVVVSPQQGMIASLQQIDEESRETLTHAVVISEKQVACFALAEGRKLAFSTGGIQLNLDCELGLTGKQDKPFRWKMTAGMTSSDQRASHSPLTVATSLAPVTFVAATHEDANCRWDGSTLTLESKSGTYRIDERTGAMIGGQIESEDGEAAVQLLPRRNAFQQRHEQILAMAESHQDAFDDRRPLSSIASFLCTTIASCLKQLAPEDRPLPLDPAVLHVAARLIDEGLLTPADTIFPSVALQTFGPALDIPIAHEQALTREHGWIALTMAVNAETVIPRESWAWTISRELVLTYLGHGVHAEGEVAALVEPNQLGPSGYWLAAEVLNFENRRVAGDKKEQAEKPPYIPAQLTALMAKRGRALLSADAFVAEWEAGLNADMRSALAASTRAIGTLSEEDTATLASAIGLPPPVLSQLLKPMRSAGQAPPTEVFQGALRQVWSMAAKGMLEARLRQLEEVAEKVAEKEKKVR